LETFFIKVGANNYSHIKDNKSLSGVTRKPDFLTQREFIIKRHRMFAKHPMSKNTSMGEPRCSFLVPMCLPLMLHPGRIIIRT